MASDMVYVELDKPCKTLELSVKYLQGLIPSHYKVYKHGANLAVDVPDSTDSVGELCRVLDSKGESCFVYKPDTDQVAANNLTQPQLAEAAEPWTPGSEPWEHDVLKNKMVTLVGPVREEDGKWFIPYVGSSDVSGARLWAKHGGVEFKEKEKAEELRSLLVSASTGYHQTYSVDDWDTFLAVAILYKQGIEWNRPK